MSELQKTTPELLSQLQTGECSSEQLVQDCLDEIARADGNVNAFLHVDGDAALEQARAVDARRTAGENVGALAGLPVAVKDNLCMLDVPTTCGSRMLETFKPPYDAHVVQRLRAADAVVVGKTNLDELSLIHI